MVLVGLLLAYAYPVRVYLAQQAEIAGLEQQQREQRERIAGLADERAKWDDPEFVKAKAKKELHYVQPGEILYLPAYWWHQVYSEGAVNVSVNFVWFASRWKNLRHLGQALRARRHVSRALAAARALQRAAERA